MFFSYIFVQQENCTNKNYVQISMESYARMSGLEDQVVNLEDQVKDLESKLSAAYSELDNKENLVKQHAKVAEEAVSGSTYCTDMHKFKKFHITSP
jgi:hypothetical protein